MQQQPQMQPQMQGQVVGGSTQPQQPPPQQGQGMGANLPPEIMQKLMQVPEPKRSELMRQLSQDYAGARDMLDDQQGMSQQLRQGAPKAEGRQAGNVYTAANPMEHIASAYQQRKATDMQQDSLDQKKKLAEDYGMATQEVMQSMLRSK